MGTFSNKIKRFLNKGISLAELDHNSYFLRLSTNKNSYIHFVGKTKDQVEYKPMPTIVGAAVWTWQNAIIFIKESGVTNLEMIRVDEALKTQEG